MAQEICSNFCTAEKCAELEAKIEQLQLDLALLREIVDGHILQSIPLAHDYNPPAPEVYFDIFELDDGGYIFKITVDGNSDSDSLFLSPPSVLLDIFETGEDSYVFKISVDGETDEDTLTITHPDLEIPPPIQPPSRDLRINGSYRDEQLTITVSDGINTDSFQVNIPRNGRNISVNNSDLENILNRLLECCNNNSNDLNAVLNLLNQVRDEVTVNITGNSYTIDCVSEEFEEQANSPFLVPKVEVQTQTIAGNGINGLAILINDLATKLKELDQRICNNQTPSFNFTTELPLSCESGLQNQTLEQYLTANSNLSWLKFLVTDLRNNGATGNNLNINNNYHIYLIYMLHLIHEQQKSLLAPVCELENQDTVAIVASDRVIKATKTKQLILHFVTLDNYPKRQTNSSYRPVQIPLPIPNEDLDWATHFHDLRWHQGNLYAELELQDADGNKFMPSVSGFFEDQTKAYAYFDAILALTTLSELRRGTNPKTNPTRTIPVRETRPYRAFVCSVNETGQAVVEFKLQPTAT